MITHMSVRDLIIVGAGPSGLATAIAAGQAGLDYTVLEKGVLVNSIYQFPVHMSFFTTPELLEIGGVPLVTPYEKPTRIEALRYYRRVAEKFDLGIEFGRQVTGLDRDAATGVLTVTSTTSTGTRTDRARAVVFAVGYYDHPNRLGVPGEDLPHVSHYYRDAHACYRQRVVIVGGKNSAAEAALELFRAGAHVTLVHRRSTLGASIKYWVKPDIDNRIAEGSIPARFDTRVVEITPEAVIVEPARAAAAGRALPAGRCPPTACSCSPAITPTSRCSRPAASASIPTAACRRTTRRRSKATSRTCSWPAACWRGRTPRQSSSRTAGSTASDW